MAVKTITGKVTGPDGTNKTAVITATLSQACVITGTQETIPSIVKVTAASDGTYTLTLQANNDMTPTGTFYAIIESSPDGGYYAFNIVVPQTAGPFVMSNIQSAPPTLGSSPSHVSTLTVDAAATFTAGPVTFPAGGIADAALSSNVALLTGTQTFTGAKTFPSVALSGLTGATAASRYVGATASGAPVSGTFALGDFIVDQTAAIWICTVAGTPGTWGKLGVSTVGTLGYAQVTSSQSGITGNTDLTGMTVTVTTVAGRRYRISFLNTTFSSVAGDSGQYILLEDATQIQVPGAIYPIANASLTVTPSAIRTPSAGSHTYKVQLGRQSGTGSITSNHASYAPAYILVEDIGV